MRITSGRVTRAVYRADDEMLLALLRELFEQVDPVPDHVRAGARAAFERGADRDTGPA